MSAIDVLLARTRSAARFRNMLRLMVEREVFKFGEFTLKSGQQSPIYIDLRECFASKAIMDIAVKGLIELIENGKMEFDGIVGVPYAALPYATLVSNSLEKPLIITRKEAKSYGTKKLVEGVYKQGQKVIIIEDVVTTGSSILEVVALLRKEGLVVDHVFCLLDRQQGGEEKLAENNIKLHSLLSVETALNYLFSVGKIDTKLWDKIVKALDLQLPPPSRTEVSTKYENETLMPLVHYSFQRTNLTKRAEGAKSEFNRKLYPLMIEKKTNICLAADYIHGSEILKIADELGEHFIALKIHADIIIDFSPQFIQNLQALAEKHKFFIFEDRKYADTGMTNLLQLGSSTHGVASWADVVTMHAVQGEESITAVRKLIKDPSVRLSGILLIAELSTAGCLTALPGYTTKAIEMANSNRDIIAGFICQTKLSAEEDMLHWTPGVNFKSKSDGSGQQWRGVEEAIQDQQNDIIIVGRGITTSIDPSYEICKYKAYSWPLIN